MKYCVALDNCVNLFAAFRAPSLSSSIFPWKQYVFATISAPHTPKFEVCITRVDCWTSVIEGRKSERAGGRGKGGSPGERVISANNARACECVQFNDFQPEFR